MPEAPSVAIVVINYNSSAFIDEFIDSLRLLDYPRWHLVVVDSGSSDDSASRIERAFPDASIARCPENVGFAAGINIVLDQGLTSDEEYILFLNPDTVLTPSVLRALVDASDLSTVVVPKILYKDDPRLVSTHAGGFDWRLGLFRDTFHGQLDGSATSHRRDGLQTASFACALVPAQAFTDAGRMDERFFMYYEETDWLKRAGACGFRIRYEPSGVVYHRESGSSGGGWMTPFKMYYATRNRPYLVRKHRRGLADAAVFHAYFLATRMGSTARLAARRDWHLLRAMWLGVVDYYRGRMGRRYQPGDF